MEDHCDFEGCEEPALPLGRFCALHAARGMRESTITGRRPATLPRGRALRARKKAARKAARRKK